MARAGPLASEGRAEREADPLPTYLLHHPDRHPELVEADYLRDESPMVSLRGTALVMGRPRDVVVQRVPAHVRVEQLPG